MLAQEIHASLGNQEVINWIADLRRALDGLYRKYHIFEPRVRVTNSSIIVELRSYRNKETRFWEREGTGRIERRVPMSIDTPEDAYLWWTVMEEIEQRAMEYAAIVQKVGVTNRPS